MAEIADTELSSLFALDPAFPLGTTFHWSLHGGVTMSALWGVRRVCTTACGAGLAESRSADGARLPVTAWGAA